VSSVQAPEAPRAPRADLVRARRPPALVPLAIGIAWSLAVLAELTGDGAKLHHDALIHSALPLWVALLLFLVSWQAMIAAMMLPSSLPMIALFQAVTAAQPRRRAVMGSFMGGYAAVWTGFGAVAFLGDAVFHRFVDATPSLSARPWLIQAGVLALAGAFQFSSLKDRCLSVCRAPGPYLLQHYRRRGPAAALRLGVGHGLFCVGCCWALMLLMFAAGVANLWWMAALTAVMVYEKVGRHGDRITRPVGFALLALAALIVAHGLELVL
jgi:predicted metal-binding membrane protein